MKDIELFSLYSGSAGNAFLVAAHGVCFLIDAGKSARSLCTAIRSCGHNPDDVQAIFVTHEHNDHINAIPVFLKQHPVPVHLPEDCVYKLADDPWVQERLCPHTPVDSVLLGDIRITSFPTPHDSRGSVGYRVEIPTPGGMFRLGYATDIGYAAPTVEQNLTGCQAVVLESNHDPDMLRNGPYPAFLKQRIASRRGHLSNAESACLAARLCSAGTRSLMLAHLSMENNTPDTAYSECFGCIASDAVQLCIAQPDCVTKLPLEPGANMEDWICSI